MKRYYLYIVVGIVSAYIACQIFADITSLRIVRILSFSVDAGTLIYPLTFTLRDMAHKVLGKKVVRALIVYAGILNLLMATLFWLVGKLPADMVVGPQQEFMSVLSPVWRIVFASIAAEVVSELLDTEIYHALRHKTQWMRVLTSNGLSVPVDSVIFCFVGFYGVVPLSVVWEILTSNIVLKYVVTILSIPLVYMVPHYDSSSD